MEDDVLRQLLAVQTEILTELRLLRQAVTEGVPVRPVRAAQPAASQPTEPKPATPQAATPQAVAAKPDEPREAAPQHAPQAPVAAPEPASAQPPASPRRAGRGMMTMDELTELGGQFLDDVPRPKTRTKPIDAGELGGSLLDEIKAKNRAKRDAFAEFERLRRDR